MCCSKRDYHINVVMSHGVTSGLPQKQWCVSWKQFTSHHVCSCLWWLSTDTFHLEFRCVLCFLFCFLTFLSQTTTDCIPSSFPNHLPGVGSMWQLTSGLSCVPQALLRKSPQRHIFYFSILRINSVLTPHLVQALGLFSSVDQKVEA